MLATGALAAPTQSVVPGGVALGTMGVAGAPGAMGVAGAPGTMGTAATILPTGPVLMAAPPNGRAMSIQVPGMSLIFFVVVVIVAVVVGTF